MHDEQLEGRLLGFLRERFLDGDPRNELTAESPLLEWGVLTSMNTVIFLMFIRNEIGVQVPPEAINGTNLHSVRTIAAMVTELSAAAGTSR
ncbi:acyl carrier protein [Kitasatospora sp. NPDC092286]|uniref:acyl carrier protein n=1 Tax=Kitasatospora sp. NPDC092286 TaxID=3364087 RepID=UPI00380B329A